MIILRRTQPNRPRIFKVPLVPWFPLISIILCGGLMTGLTVVTWLRFVIWLGLGLLIYIFYSRHRSEFREEVAAKLSAVSNQPSAKSRFVILSEADPRAKRPACVAEGPLHLFGAIANARHFHPRL